MPTKTAPSTLDGHAAEIWEAAYESAWSAYDSGKHTGSQEEYAAKTAWAAVKSAGYEKSGDKWVKASDARFTFALRFAKVRRDESTGIVTFHAQAACTELDTSGTEVLEPELFDDLAFTYREIMDAAEAGEPLPEYWFGQAQLPILDLTHSCHPTNEIRHDWAQSQTCIVMVGSCTLTVCSMTPKLDSWPHKRSWQMKRTQFVHLWGSGLIGETCRLKMG